MKTSFFKRGRHEGFKARKDLYYKNKRSDLEGKDRLQAVLTEHATCVSWQGHVKDIIPELKLCGDFVVDETLDSKERSRVFSFSIV